MNSMIAALMKKYAAMQQGQQNQMRMQGQVPQNGLPPDLMGRMQAQAQQGQMQNRGLAELFKSYMQPNQTPPIPGQMPQNIPAQGQMLGGVSPMSKQLDQNGRMYGGTQGFYQPGGGRSSSSGLGSLLDRIRSGLGKPSVEQNAQIRAKPMQLYGEMRSPTGLGGLMQAATVQRRTGGRPPGKRFAAGGLVDEEGEPAGEGSEAMLMPEGTPTDFMTQMLAQYAKPQNQYAEELNKARGDAASKQQEFDALLQQAAQQKSQGPSRAEMFFNLAAAFGTPGKTGNFFEQLGGAGKVLADDKRQQRESESAQRTQNLNLGLERAKLGIASSRDEMNTLRSLASEESRGNRAMALEQVKAMLAAGKPQSEAGKIAVDAGMKPGTPEYNAFVKKYVQDKIDSGALYKQAMLGVAQAGVGLRTQQVATATAQAAKLSPAEVKMKDEMEASMNAAKVAYAQLAKVYAMPDSAYAGSGIDRLKKGALGAVGSEDPAYVQAQEVDNLLGRAGVAGLKTTLGPQISDSDVRIGTALEGLTATSGAARKKIVKNTMDALKESYLYRKKRYEALANGQYRIAEPRAQFGELPEEENAMTMEDLGAP